MKAPAKLVPTKVKSSFRGVEKKNSTQTLRFLPFTRRARSQFANGGRFTPAHPVKPYSRSPEWGLRTEKTLSVEITPRGERTPACARS